MKYFRLALVAFASALGLVRAEDEQNRAPPTDIPDFSNLDEYIYEPKSTLILGFRMLSGAKMTFSGTGKLLSPEDPGPVTGANIQRLYHDGFVNPDQRVAARTDSGGNIIIDPITGGQVIDPIAPDGHTNTWSYGDARQGTEIPGMVTFHSYSADITDTSARKTNASSAFGVEVAVQRDMGSLFHTRASWSLLAGVSLNDISAKTSDGVRASITTITDVYSLDGQVLPALPQTTTPVLDSAGNPVNNADGTPQTTVTGTTPYSAPSTGSTTVLDSAGNPVLNEDGSTQTVATDTTVLLGNQPVDRQTKTTVDSVSVTNRWKLKGAYFTFRAGPVITIPITTRLKFNFSAGAAMLVVGSYYTVQQSFQPEFGSEIADAPANSSYGNTNTSSAYKVLPGYYADASLQFDVTDHTGIFAGAAFQGAGSYVQKLENDTMHYQTKVDLGKQQGLRAGMTIRF